MGLFNKDTPDQLTVTGTDILRQATKARNRSPNALSMTASNVKGDRYRPAARFRLNGKADLSVEMLQALAKELFHGHAVFDVESGMLKTANTTPPLTYTPPSPFVRGPNDYDPAAAAEIVGPRLRFEKPQPKQPDPRNRPGWLRSS